MNMPLHRLADPKHKDSYMIAYKWYNILNLFWCNLFSDHK